MFARESEGERKQQQELKQQQRQPNPSTINGIDKFQGGLGRFFDQKLRVAVQINKKEKHCTNLLSFYFSLRPNGAEMRVLFSAAACKLLVFVFEKKKKKKNDCLKERTADRS